MCVDGAVSGVGDNAPMLRACAEDTVKESQLWDYTGGQLKNVRTGLCIDRAGKGNSATLSMLECNEKEKGQIWTFDHVAKDTTASIK